MKGVAYVYIAILAAIFAGYAAGVADTNRLNCSTQEGKP